MGRGRPKKSDADNQLNLARAHRLKRLREECTDVSVLKKICYAKNKGICEKLLKSVTNFSFCEKCTSILLSKITQADLENALSYDVNNIENGRIDNSPGSPLIEEYENVFTVERVNEYLEDGSIFFERKIKASEPNWFLERDNEKRALKELVDKNNITVIRADGGVGKTTLVEQFISELSLADDYNYYDTFIFSDKDEKDLSKAFLSKIVLSNKGKEEFNIKYGGDDENRKYEFVRNKLKKALISPLFFLDNFESINGETFSQLQNDFPNCKFIITTRNVDECGNNYDKCVIDLAYFTLDQALRVFNARRIKNYAKETTKDEFVPIYEFSEGNAEVLYFIVQMLGISDISKFNDCLPVRNFMAKNKKTGEVENSDMSQKLKLLFGLDKVFLSKLSEENSKIVRALTVLSITGMQPIPMENLIQFLTGDESSEQETVDVLSELIKKGFIKSNNGNVYMHPLMQNALKLNKIEEHYSDDVKLFAYLMIGDFRLQEKFEIDKIRVLRIPNGISTIEEALFEGCDVEEVYIPRHVFEIKERAFKSCFDLKKLNFEDGLQHIGWATFKNCSQIVEIIFPNTMISIGDNAFEGCSSLDKIKFNEELKVIGYKSFCDCDIYEISIPNSVEKIGDRAFEGNFLDKVEYGPFTDLGYNCFGEQEGYDDDTYLGFIPDTETYRTIGELRLTKDDIEIHGKDILYKDNAIYSSDFKTLVKYRCKGVKESFVIPESVTIIHPKAFSVCKDLEYIEFNLELNAIGDGAFALSGLKSLNIPNNVTYLGPHSFFGCKNLEKITIGEGLNRIEKDTFLGCKSLKEVWIGENVRRIYDDAFYGCKELKYIFISKNVECISESAFEKCGDIHFEVDEKNEKFSSKNGFLYLQQEKRYFTHLYRNKEGRLENINFNSVEYKPISLLAIDKTLLCIAHRDDEETRDLFVFKINDKDEIKLIDKQDEVNDALELLNNFSRKF